MALTREQVNALARHVIKTPQQKQQSKHAELMQAFRRLHGPLPSPTVGEALLPPAAALAQFIGQLPDNRNQ